MKNYLSTVHQFIEKHEKWVFWILLLVNALPVLCLPFFPTVDGPSHLYNARLILELMGGEETSISNYFCFHDHFSFNWSSHLTLAFLLKFFSAAVSEKIILLFFIVGFPLAVRSVFRSMDLKFGYVLYLVFPFTYSYLFYYGLYNFNIALVLFFFGISAYYRLEKERSLKNYLKLSLLSLLICLSHLFVFAFFALIIFVMSLFAKERDVVKFFKTMLSLLPAFPLLLQAYLTRESSRHEMEYLSASDIYGSIKYMMPLKGINDSDYRYPVRLLTILFALYIGYWIVNSVMRSGWKEMKGSEGLRWAGLLVFTFLLLFILPDTIFNFGFITARLLLMLFIVFLVWIAMAKVPHWMDLTAFIIALLIFVFSLQHNYRSNSKYAYVAYKLSEIALKIEPYSIVLPVNCSEEKHMAHLTSYAGTRIPMVLLDNYEANLNFFPLKWNEVKMKEPRFGDLDPVKCLNDQRPYGLPGGPPVDYVLWVKDEGNCGKFIMKDEMLKVIANDYTLVTSDDRGMIALYKRKQ